MTPLARRSATAAKAKANQVAGAIVGAGITNRLPQKSAEPVNPIETRKEIAKAAKAKANQGTRNDICQISDKSIEKPIAPIDTQKRFRRILQKRLLQSTHEESPSSQKSAKLVKPIDAREEIDSVTHRTSQLLKLGLDGIQFLVD